jgi:transcriptional antiterminator NusG
MESEKRWYVIHTYSGYENKVTANLERKIHSLGMENEIFNVLVPMEDEVEVKDGKKKVTSKKVFPGYVLVEMIVNDRSWYEIGRASCRERV